MANPKMYRPEWISDRLRQPWQAEAEKYEATAKAAAGTRCVVADITRLMGQTRVWLPAYYKKIIPAPIPLG